MIRITSQNAMPLTISDTLTVGIYPFPGIQAENLFVLDLARKADLAIVATGEESLENCDAAVTLVREFSLGIRTRDCAPICLGDGRRIGIAHVGWQGYSLGLIEKILPYFDPEKVSIYVGPFLNAFEIKRDFCYDALMAKPGAAEHVREDETGKLIFHFKDAIAALLPETAVFDTRDTLTDLSLPSNRRDPESKGFLTTVRFA